MSDEARRVKTLYATTDAQVWAREFMQVVEGGATVDEGLMIGWFANAMATAEAHMTPPAAPVPGTPHTSEEREEWQAGVELAVCLIEGCDYLDIDPRGPVFLRDDRTPYYACTEHWEAIVGILGRQVGSGDEMRFAPGADES